MRTFHGRGGTLVGIVHHDPLFERRHATTDENQVRVLESTGDRGS